MFSELLYLILALLVTAFLPTFPLQEPETVMSALALYTTLLIVVVALPYLLKRALRHHMPKILFLLNTLLLSSLIYLYHIQQIHYYLPLLHFSYALSTVILYLLPLFLFHANSYPYLTASARGTFHSRVSYGWGKICFLIPFTLPFLLFSALYDFLLFGKISNPYLIGFLTLLALVGTALFSPPIIQWCWRCRTLKDPNRRKRLEAICKKAHFRCADIKTWGVMNHAHTAAIMGLLAPLRYILFSRKLLGSLRPESIDAVLAHEIAHSKHHHLVHYPFIFSGNFLLLVPTINILEGVCAPSILSFFICSLLILTYIRITFGYFSRLFEREADLYVYTLDIPPGHMQQALFEIGHAMGGSHSTPCWHHYSLQERIQFLEKTIETPSLITAHHKRVKRSLFCYYLILALAILWFFFGG